ncbi:hypothetical protein N566_15775 [Streptomycetaceae bacterium MP113-05]|nr:hypothetical protein N566_15775 [Streptomycetaceae bacterium MP113-05]
MSVMRQDGRNPSEPGRRAARDPVPRPRSGMVGRHQERTGTEPATARSALGLRLLLSSVFLPVFLAATALFWYWTQSSGPQDAPSSGSLRVLAIACAVLSALALADLLAVLRRRRREYPGSPPTR